MSKNAVEGFFNSVKSDQNVRHQLGASASEKAFLATAVRLGAEHGFILTAEELMEAGFKTSANTELSEEELAGVAGGAFDPWIVFRPWG
jgi:predicted ribosomally synthesized peptide with nif11-like leader